MTTTTGLIGALARACKQNATRVALEDGERHWTFEQVATRVAELTASIERAAPADTSLVPVYADRSPTAAIAMAAVLASGRAYLRLDPRDPAERTRAILRSAGCSVLATDRDVEKRLREQVLSGLRCEYSVVSIDRSTSGGSAPRLEPLPADWDAPASVHYAAGSGEPYGVAITRASLSAALRALSGRLALSRDDLVLAQADPSSDHELPEYLLAWEVGARVCCPPKEQSLLPLNYVRERGITAWFLAPSRAAYLDALGVLAPGLLPSLKRTFFTGELMTSDLARRWSATAPNSELDVFYGPADAPGACTAYRWDSVASPNECEDGVLPLGQLLPGLTGRIVDSEGRELPAGVPGELVLQGPQITGGLPRRSEPRADAFLQPLGRREEFLRTGDLVRRDRHGLLLHEGRVDQQLRVRGFRVELAEVERHLSEASGGAVAVAIGWPMTARGADGIVAFVESTAFEPAAVRRALRSRLPRYMIPQKIVMLPSLPRTPSGQLDRGRLRVRTADCPTGLTG